MQKEFFDFDSFFREKIFQKRKISIWFSLRYCKNYEKKIFFFEKANKNVWLVSFGGSKKCNKIIKTLLFQNKYLNYFRSKENAEKFTVLLDGSFWLKRFFLWNWIETQEVFFGCWFVEKKWIETIKKIVNFLLKRRDF